MSDEYPQVDRDRVPRHVGLIMDGNGRWAQARGLHRTQGHAAGEAALFDVVDGALDLGVGWLTAYTFSTENWKRSEEEVQFLLHFNVEVLQRRRNSLHDKGVRIRFIGDRDDARVHQGLRDEFAAAEEMTKDNKTLELVLAFNYGGRAEIARAVRSLAEQVAAGSVDPAALTEADVASHLAIGDMPDADVLIRSSGEHRVSNFLMWQAAYAELVVSPLMWPDFNRNVFADCIAEYQGRDRRFGAAG
ncbi:MAG: di-trans,poly-cis-decaprenylcistransferase [bacterium]|nr:di-trans,poly-cis-decaprenylcistransferase [bacterium]